MIGNDAGWGEIRIPQRGITGDAREEGHVGGGERDAGGLERHALLYILEVALRRQDGGEENDGNEREAKRPSGRPAVRVRAVRVAAMSRSALQR